MSASLFHITKEMQKKKKGQLALSLANSHFISGSILGVCQHSPASKYKFDLSKKHDAEYNYNNLFFIDQNICRISSISPNKTN